MPYHGKKTQILFTILHPHIPTFPPVLGEPYPQIPLWSRSSLIAMASYAKFIYEHAVSLFLSSVERGFVPDVLLRSAIRYLLRIRSKAAVSGTMSNCDWSN